MISMLGSILFSTIVVLQGCREGLEDAGNDVQLQ